MIKLTAKQKWNFRKKFDPLGPDDCWEWQAGTRKDGYGQFRVNGNMELAHRVAFFIKYDSQPEFVLHTCDNKACVNSNHLYDGTCSENQIDRAQRGSCHKLTPNDVLEIRYLLALGLTHKSIAKRFGVDRVTITDINTGKTWSHVK